MSSPHDKSHPADTPGPVPMPVPPPNRRASFSQNPSFSTLFGSNRGSPPRPAPDPAMSLGRRFSWSYAPPPARGETSPSASSEAIDDSEDMVASPAEEHGRRGSEIGRRLSTTASSLREALGFKVEEPGSPKGIKTVPSPTRSRDPCAPLKLHKPCSCPLCTGSCYSCTMSDVLFYM